MTKVEMHPNTVTVLISGKQGSGKSTTADILAKMAESKYQDLVCIRARFAAKIYEYHDILWKDLAKYGYQLKAAKDGKLLQILGTEWGRYTIDQNIWPTITRDDVITQTRRTFSKVLVIIDDARFPNELEIFKDDNSLKVRLTAPEQIRRARCGTHWRNKILLLDWQTIPWWSFIPMFLAAGLDGIFSLLGAKGNNRLRMANLLFLKEHPSETSLDDYQFFETVLDTEKNTPEACCAQILETLEVKYPANFKRKTANSWV